MDAEVQRHNTHVGNELALRTQLSESYRKARSLTSFAAGAGLAWSTAQIDVKATSAQFFGLTIDLNSTAIPVCLIAAIAYLSARTWIEYAMQSNDVRRWDKAKSDLRLTAVIVRVALVALMLQFLSRSVDGMLYFAVSLFYAWGLVLLAATPIRRVFQRMQRIIVEDHPELRDSPKMSEANAHMNGQVWAVIIVMLGWTAIVVNHFDLTRHTSNEVAMIFAMLSIGVHLVFADAILPFPHWDRLFAESD